MEYSGYRWRGHGGAREGAGRPKMGETRRVSITLPESEWAKIDGIYSALPKMTQAAYFRMLHYQYMKQIGKGETNG